MQKGKKSWQGSFLADVILMVINRHKNQLYRLQEVQSKIHQIQSAIHLLMIHYLAKLASRHTPTETIYPHGKGL